MDLHIILDIDQTLVDNMSMNEYENNKNKLRKPDFMKETMCIWTRPHLKEFIEFLDKNVKYISIWTNGSFSWLYYVLTTILSKYLPKKRFLLLLSIEYSIKQEITNKYRAEHVELIKEQQQQYKQDHKDIIKEQMRKYRQEHKAEIYEKKKEYMEANKEHLQAKKKAWEEANKEQRKEKRKIYEAKKKAKLLEQQQQANLNI